jgi:hypothetical protein
MKKEEILKDLDILNEQLLKIANLTKNIFSVQKYDLEKIELYLQKHDII